MALSTDYIYDAMKRFSSSTGYITPGAKDEVLAYLDQIPNLIILGEDKKGLIIGYVGPCAFNPNVLVASEIMWWVEKAYRCTPFGIRLLQLFEHQAKSLGASKIIMTAIENSNGVAINIYPRVGYQKIETNFIKEL